MGLDFNLINQATKHALNSLENLEKTDCPAVFLVSNLINDELFDKLSVYIQETSLWEKDDTTYRGNRLKLTWAPDTVIEELHIVLESVTSKMNDLFNRNNHFLGLTIWKDLETYTITPHTDNPIIDVSMQIYLTEGDSKLGTAFRYNKRVISARYQKNNGYIMDNQAKISHYLTKSVPAGHVRYSVYAIWSNSNK